MINGVSYDVYGYDTWNGKKIKNMSDEHRENAYNMLVESCKNLGVEIVCSGLDYDRSDEVKMEKGWLEKYAYGFKKEFEKYL